MVRVGHAILTECFVPPPCVECQISHVTCHIVCVIYLMSYVTIFSPQNVNIYVYSVGVSPKESSRGQYLNILTDLGLGADLLKLPKNLNKLG